LPILHIKNFNLPVAGLFTAVTASGFSYLLSNSIYGSLVVSNITALALGSKHLPLWSNKNYAVNPDRAYFELDDDKGNSPTIFHSGLYSIYDLELRKTQVK